MSRFSDDKAVEQAVTASEADYRAAQDALRGSPEDPALVAAYREASNNFFTARQAARAGRGMAIIIE